MWKGIVSLVLAAGAAGTLAAQSNGRFETIKRQGYTYLKAQSFDKAAARFEEVWEQDQSDPEVAESLAVAYLNSEDRAYSPSVVKKAYELMRAAADKNRRITFLIAHSHERLGLIQGRQVSNYCAGQLTLEPGRMVFLSETKEKPAEHSFELIPSEIEELKEIEGGETSGAFRLKFRGRTFNLYPRTWKDEDRAMLLEFAKRYLNLN